MNSDVTIVGDIRLAIVENETMLLIDSKFNNRKSLKSARNNLVRVMMIKRGVNGKGTHG
jgi:hypothetical protein